MSGFFGVLALALLPAAGSLLGALLAESARMPRWMIGAALHAAAGVAIAVVSIDLMPRILPVLSAGALIAAFLAGAAGSVLLARGVGRLRRAFGSGSAGAWMVYVAVAANLLSDGLMTGAGSAVSGNLGLVLALSQMVGNLPGGFAAVANFRDEGMRRSARFLLAASFALPILFGAVLGYALLRGAGPAVQNGVLAFIVGVLLLATVEDALPQADEPGAPRWISTAAFALGFAFLALIASALG